MQALAAVPEPRARPAGLAAMPATPRDVLVTDDDAETRSLYRDALRSRGHTVRMAATGDECLELARESRPDLLILDLHMPVRDGFTTALLLRSDPSTWSVPVLAVTGISQPREIDRAFRSGCDIVLNKPVSIPDLLRASQMLIEGAHVDERYAYAEHQRTLAGDLLRTSYPDLRALRLPDEAVTETELRQWMQAAQVTTCSFCGKVRGATGGWRPIAPELREFLERWTTLSHGICRDCFVREYPGTAAGSPP